MPSGRPSKANLRAKARAKVKARAKAAKASLKAKAHLTKAKERAKVSLKALSHRRPHLKEKVSSQVALLRRAFQDHGLLNILMASLRGTGLGHKLLQEFSSILRVIGLRIGNSLGTLVGQI